MVSNAMAEASTKHLLETYGPQPGEHRDADGIIIVSPEYGWTIPGALKNAPQSMQMVEEPPSSGFYGVSQRREGNASG